MPRAALAEPAPAGSTSIMHAPNLAAEPDQERRIEDWLVCHLEGEARAGATGRPALDAMVVSWSLALKGPNAGAPRPKSPSRPEPSGPKWARLKVAARGEATVVRFKDPTLLREDDLREAALELNALIAAGHRRIVLNFAGVDRMSSQIVGAIAAAHQRCAASDGGQLRVCNLRNGLEQILALTGLEGRVAFFADEAAALTAPWPTPKGPRPLPVSILAALSSRDESAGAGGGGSVIEPDGPATAIDAPGASGLWLVILSGKRKGRVIAVCEDLFVIGREAECDLRVECSTVSRRHAVLERQGCVVLLRDLGTTNGTVHNDTTLRHHEAVLADGDHVRIGPLKLAVVLGRRPESLPPADEEIVGWLRDDMTDEEMGRTTSPEVPLFDEQDDRPLKSEVIEGVLVVTPLAATIEDEATIAPLRDGLNALLDSTLPRRVVMNLDRVGTLSSRAVGMIVAHSLRLERLGGSIRLCQPSAPVLALLEHIRLPMLVEVFTNLDDAVLSSWEREAE